MIAFYAVLVPAIASLFILIFHRHPNIRESCTIIATFVTFILVFLIAQEFLDGKSIECTIFEILPGIEFAFKVDAFGLIFALTSSSLWILVSLYSIGYMRALKEHAQTRYYFCFAISIMSALGIAFSENLITLFIFYETLTIVTYPLVSHEESEEALVAGRKYLLYLMTSGSFLLAASLITYAITGTTDFKPGGILNPMDEVLLKILFFFYILGFMKAAYMPFHSWLPTAMIAPTPVSALLHAVAVVKAGVFGIIRVVCYIYGIDLIKYLNLDLILAVLASFTVIVANLLAIGEDNFKRRLAYSTINQLSFIILGASLLSPLALMGAMMHITFHGYMKITLFLCAGAIAVVTGKKLVSELSGVGKVMPITMIAFTIGAIGMAGLPPTAGFLGKLYICLGAVQSAETFAQPLLLSVILVVIIASILDIIYLLPIVISAFFEGSEGVKREEFRDVLCLFMVVSLSITAIFSILLFIYPSVLLLPELAEVAANEVFKK
ncbi:MAG: monovalent cation/H+ antiporter subunit D family protein [Archaeoglobaceae archaeon]|nr:monovalent cation/H+ antiporter subunit D family protein [Archaeoglobaceae archaeon]MCX8152761.1 monovalent cation/H+ antiporter subunit D family protein [Archaeoglobaceae archaeon]MDW8013468.1 monovalent cation/H+ antiporter subunit D family protein [Archaeoglobaceae archaeon]